MGLAMARTRLFHGKIGLLFPFTLRHPDWYLFVENMRARKSEDIPMATQTKQHINATQFVKERMAALINMRHVQIENHWNIQPYVSNLHGGTQHLGAKNTPAGIYAMSTLVYNTNTIAFRKWSQNLGLWMYGYLLEHLEGKK
jgi:hypothetical protein